MVEQRPQGASVETTELGAFETIRRGIVHAPVLVKGIGLTTLYAVVSSFGQVVVPVAIQQALDKGLGADGGPDLSFTVKAVLVAAAMVVLTTVSAALMTARLFRSAETGLAELRSKAFAHIHRLAMLTQSEERRGSLVSRVTSDVDQISTFLVFGGLILVISVGQLVLATVVMAWYSWPLALMVWVCFAPLFISIRWFQRRLSAAYTHVRATVGTMLATIAEPVVAAPVVKSYAIEGRTQIRIDAVIDANREAQTTAQWYTVTSFSLGGISSGFANAGVILGGVWLGQHAGWWDLHLTVGKVLAFAFLVTLFVGPVQLGTQIITDAQNAIASWRRVIGILDTPLDLVVPGEEGRSLPRGPISVEFDDVDFAYPGGAPVLRSLGFGIEPGRRVAVVGETGSGKSTIAKLLTRLMDPARGRVLLDGVDLREISGRSLRSSVVLVPQEGFLFDDTLRANLLYGKLDATDPEILAAADALGLGDWLTALPHGLDTPAGQRGESLSAGERQLVSLLRAQLADPDLLVLDEATSAVDPALEMRINRALERLMRGRTSVTISHRLSTAEASDEVFVIDRGVLVQRGPANDLAQQEGTVYHRLHQSWISQRS